MYSDARRAYDDASLAAPTSRELEARALYKAARLFEDCKTRWESGDIGGRLEEALRYNLQLWSFFQSEILEPGSPLPPDLKANLLTLSAYVDQRTFEVMANPAPEKLQVLIDINRALAQGLALSPAASATGAELAA